MKNFRFNVRCASIIASYILLNSIIFENQSITESNINCKQDIILPKEKTNFEEYCSETNNKQVNYINLKENDNIFNKNNDEKSIVISFAGDCTLGNDKKVTYFNDMVKSQNDYSYFFENVKDIFNNDDYTLVNLETTFTDSNLYSEKQFNFKGDYDYVNILKEGCVEGVNISNNHTNDYLEKGYNDTIKTLEGAQIDYSGDDFIHIEEIKGIKIGFIGFKNANLTYENIDSKLIELKKYNPEIVIASCHWGKEGTNQYNNQQQEFGRYLIDNGVDLVVGHHPHVLQGIEEYKGKHIIYSLGNFCFGGNRNPKDKDTMIVQETFELENNELINSKIKIIPCSISSSTKTNNFQPTPLHGDEHNRVIEKVLKYSHNFNYTNNN